jgi:signal transduction histidine kinase
VRPPLFVPEVAEAAHHATELAITARIAIAFNRRGPLGEVLDAVCRAIVDHLGVATARLWTVDRTSNALELQASAGAPPGSDAVPDAAATRSVVTHADGIAMTDPLILEDRLLGVLEVWSAEPLPPATLAALRTAAVAITVGLERAYGDHERDARLVELTEALRRADLVIGVLAHDLRNPLAAIAAANEVLRANARDEHLARPIERITSSTRRIARMIEQLLDTAKLRLGGGFAIALTRVDLRELIRQVVDELLVAHDGWRIEIEALGDPSGTWDRDRLEQALSNLVGNALVHGDRDGDVRLRIDARDRDTVTIEVTNRGHVPEPLRTRVFEPFCGTRYRDAGESRGLGLGLFITRQIVLAHGGAIELRCGDTDTTFVIRLPRAPTPAIAAATSYAAGTDGSAAGGG